MVSAGLPTSLPKQKKSSPHLKSSQRSTSRTSLLPYSAVLVVVALLVLAIGSLLFASASVKFSKVPSRVPNDECATIPANLTLLHEFTALFKEPIVTRTHRLSERFDDTSEIFRTVFRSRIKVTEQFEQFQDRFPPLVHFKEFRLVPSFQKTRSLFARPRDHTSTSGEDFEEDFITHTLLSSNHDSNCSMVSLSDHLPHYGSTAITSPSQVPRPLFYLGSDLLLFEIPSQPGMVDI